jgi:hypothetical protein
MPRKVFTAGEVLAAADVNTFLMDQSVMSFAGTAARGSAIGTATEGMLTYLNDSDSYESWNGSAWVGLGGGGGGSGNAVINSAFDIWQRGTSGTASGTSAGSGYNSDRWYDYYAGALTVSRQATGDTTNLPNIQWAARVQRNSGQTSATSIWHAQDIETVNSIPFTGKTVTFSFYARRGANYSGASNNLTFLVKSGTGTDQHILAGFTGESDVISTTATLTTTWQRFTATGTVATTATQLGVGFTYDAVGTAGADDWFEVTGVQLEAGSTATAFRRNADSLQAELAACQRYYFQSAIGNDVNLGVTTYWQNTTLWNFASFPVTMRANPTAIVSTGTDYYVFYRAGTADTVNSLAIAWVTPNRAILDNGAQASGTAGQSGMLTTGNSLSFVGFSAEL